MNILIYLIFVVISLWFPTIVEARECSDTEIQKMLDADFSRKDIEEICFEAEANEPVVDLNGTWQLSGWVNGYWIVTADSNNLSIVEHQGDEKNIVSHALKGNQFEFEEKTGPETKWKYKFRLNRNNTDVILGTASLHDTTFTGGIMDESCQLLSIPCPPNVGNIIESGRVKLVRKY